MEIQRKKKKINNQHFSICYSNIYHIYISNAGRLHTVKCFLSAQYTSRENVEQRKCKKINNKKYETARTTFVRYTHSTNASATANTANRLPARCSPKRARRCYCISIDIFVVCLCNFSTTLHADICLCVRVVTVRGSLSGALFVHSVSHTQNQLHRHGWLAWSVAIVVCCVCDMRVWLVSGCIASMYEYMRSTDRISKAMCNGSHREPANAREEENSFSFKSYIL